MRRPAWLVLVALLAPGFAHAEAVRVTAGNVSGEGWIFGDGDACLLVTARHVVEHDGRLATPMLVDAAGIVGQGIEPAVPPDTLRVDGAPMDAARLRVVGALRDHCDDDLGYEDLGPTLDRIKLTGQALYFEKVLRDGSAELVPAAIATINRDNERFTVSTPPGGAEVMASDSGSPVRLRSTTAIEQGLPLGLLVEVLDGGDAVVLRMDAIRAWLHAAPPVASSARVANAALRIVGWSAETPDAGCGPLNLLDSKASCGWRPTPRAGQSTVDIDIAPPAGTGETVSTITIEPEAGSSITGIGIEARPDGKVAADAAWDALTYCAATADEKRLACSFAPRTDSVFKAQIEGLKGGLKAISLQ